MRPLFRYLGNKSTLLKYYPKPEPTYKRIIEPFAGSMTYGLNYLNSDIELIGIEIDKRICDLYRFLYNNNIDAWYEWLISHKENFDVRSEYIPKGWEYLTRLNCCSLMTGSLKNNIVYAKNIKQQKGVIEQFKRDLAEFQRSRVTIINDSFENFVYYREGDLVFIDPPYMSSGENYKSPLDTEALKAYIEMAKSKGAKVIFTYGNEAKETFPAYEWRFCCSRTLAKARKDSTKRVRQEFLAEC